MLRLLEPGWATYLFVFITLLWWLEFLIFDRQSGGKDKTNKKGYPSFNLILGAILISLAISLTLYLFNLGNLKGNAFLIVRHAGIFLYLGGIIIRYWSLILLGNYFSRFIELKKDQPLVSSGPYRILRHPSYTGLLLLNMGLHFFIGNLPGIIISFLVLFAALHVRIIEEENSMEEVLGERYKKWNKRRKRLFPWIY